MHESTINLSIVDKVAMEFEMAWISKPKNSQPPSIQPFIIQDPRLRLPSLIRLCQIDIERRFGPEGIAKVRIEDYLEWFPEIAESIEGKLALIHAEISAKKKAGIKIIEEDYTNRFSLPVEILLQKERNEKPDFNIPDFEIIREIGKGAMGVVYLAKDLVLDRHVALKMLIGGEFAGKNTLERFSQEALALAKIQHRNIVQVFRTGVYNNLPFYTMEYCYGGNLKDLACEQTLPGKKAVEYVIQAARGVGCAHLHGIIHRDIKPENILIGFDGNLKVADFGLAKSLVDPGDLTLTGTIMGTLGYMAPEQAAGDSQKIGTEADVYSLGATLYRLVCGRAPFVGPSPESVLRMLSTEDPVSPKALAPAISRDLNNIILKCLHKTPGKRYENADSFADELQRLLDGKPVIARSLGSLEKVRRWINKNPYPTLFIGSLVLLAATTFYMNQSLQIANRDLRISEINERNNATIANEEKERADLNSKEALLAKLHAEKSEGFARKNEKLAIENQTIAAIEKNKAIQKNEQLEHQIYITKIQRAQAEWESGEFSTMREQLDSIPYSRRGWEHDFLSTWTSRNHVSRPLHERPGPRSFCFSPDGKKYVSGSNDLILISDTITGKIACSYRGSNGGIQCAEFSPDGKFVISGGEDGKIRLWGVHSERKGMVLEGHEGLVSCVGFFPDGNRVFSSSHDNTVRIWDAPTGKQIHKLQGPKTAGTAIFWGAAISPDGTKVASAGFNGTVQAWNTLSGLALFTAPGGGGEIRGVMFSPDGKTIATANTNGTAHLLDASTGKEIRAFHGHTHEVQCVCFSPDGEWLATGSRDKTIRLWDAQSGSMISTLKGHLTGVTSLCFSPDGKCILSYDWNNSTKIWLANPSPSNGPVSTRGMITSIAFDPDGKKMATGGLLHFWPALEKQHPVHLQRHNHETWNACFSSDGKFIASFSADLTIKIWDANFSKLLQTLTGHKARINSVCFCNGGKWLASGSLDKSVKIWDTQTGKELQHFDHAHEVVNVESTLLGKRVLSKDLAGVIQHYDVDQPKSFQVIAKHPGGGHGCVRFSPDGKRIASCGDEKNIRIFDAATGQPTLVLVGHTDHIRCLCFSPDGKRIASGSHDKTVKIWNAISGQEILTLKNHTREILSICFCPNGRKLFSGGNEGLWIWDASIPDEALQIKPHLDLVNHVSFDNKGSIVYGRDINGKTKGWDLVSMQEATVRFKSTDPLPGQNKSPDNQWSAYPKDNSILIINNSLQNTREAWDQEKLANWIKPDASWHTQQAAALEKKGRWFAAGFHLEKAKCILGSAFKDDKRLNSLRERLQNEAN